MTEKTYAPHTHTGRTGPLDPTLERAHLLALWEADPLSVSLSQFSEPLDAGWISTGVPAPRASEGRVDGPK